MVFMIQV